MGGTAREVKIETKRALKMHVSTIIRVLRGLEGGVFTIIHVLRGLEGCRFTIMRVLQRLDGGSAGDAAVPTCLDAHCPAHVNK